MSLDTSNKFAVGLKEPLIVVHNHDLMFPGGAHCLLKKDDALNLAAWLAVVADPEGEEFAKILEAIKKLPRINNAKP